MPDPSRLQVNDQVKFVGLPSEWSETGFQVQPEDIAFMRSLIELGYYQRICAIDEYGKPWIKVRLKVDDKYETHTWALFERTGWILKRRDLKG
jgi:hypothetical protein